MLWDYKQFLVDKEIKLYQQFILNYEPKEEDLLSQKEYKFEFTPNFCIITEKEHLFLKESLETQTYKNFTLISLDDGTKVDCDYYILCNSFLSFAPNFLFEIVSELNNNRECDFFYFDEDNSCFHYHSQSQSTKILRVLYKFYTRKIYIYKL